MNDKSIKRYSQGVCNDGAAILADGVRMTVDEIIATLNYHIKVMEVKDANINEMGGEISAMHGVMDEKTKAMEAQSKEIERLKTALKYSLSLNENLSGHMGDEKEKVSSLWELTK